VPAALSVDEVPRTVVINEVRPSEGGQPGFIEIFNRTASPVPIGGWVIADSRGARFVLPDPLTIGNGAFLWFGESQLGFAPSLSPAARSSKRMERPGSAPWSRGPAPRAPASALPRRRR